MSEAKLVAELREDHGKASARRVRRAGRVPAILYGEVKDPLALSVDAHALEMLMKKTFSTIDIEVGSKSHQVIVRDIQRHPVNDSFMHIDFMQVKKGHKISMMVDVRFEGKPKGIKEGGILDAIKHEVEISVLPKDIPGEIVVNIDDLGIGEALRVKDIKAENFELLDDPEDVLVRVEVPRIETEEETTEEILEEEAAEPEVITAREKEESEDQD